MGAIQITGLNIDILILSVVAFAMTDPDHRLTIYDIAREAGVSRATVSRVLNQRPDVSPATRAKVLKIMEKRGFVRDPAAAALACGRASAVGLLIPRLEAGWAAEVIVGVGEAAAAHQRPLLLATTAYEGRNEEHWLRLLRPNLVAGVIVILTRTSADRLKGALHAQLPLVLVDYEGYEAPFPRVEAANYAGTSQAIRHLIELGHRRIACITGNKKYGCSRARLAAYRDVIARLGADRDPDLVVEGDFTEYSGYMGAKKLLSLADPPTAIFCSNDLMAFGCLRALREAGIRVPEDISVVGFDDVPGADRAEPALTTVRQPLREMGRSAFELLLRRISEPGEASCEVLTLPTELIIRRSTAPNRKSV